MLLRLIQFPGGQVSRSEQAVTVRILRSLLNEVLTNPYGLLGFSTSNPPINIGLRGPLLHR